MKRLVIASMLISIFAAAAPEVLSGGNLFKNNTT